MQIPLSLNRRNGVALQVQIATQMRQLILKGRLNAGSSVPSSRELADMLGVSRNTVLSAYDRLIAEGYLETRKASGTSVSREISATLRRGGAPEGADKRSDSLYRKRHDLIVFRGRAQKLIDLEAPRPSIDFFVGRPSAQSFPRKTWRGLLLRNLAMAGSGLTEYGDPSGLMDLRQAIADHLGPARGIRADARQILIVGGIQEALNVIARIFVRPGTPVVIENPCYQGAAFAFESYGAEIIGVPVDSDGLLVERLPERSVSLGYVTPSHQFPTGETMPLSRRIKLIEWAQRVGAYIVEDDYDSDFRYDGPPLTAVAGMETGGSVIYLGTFSKSIGAGLRLGYMVVPPQIAEVALAVKTILNNGSTWLEQAALADFIKSGAYARHLRRIQRQYKSRLDTLVHAVRTHLKGVTVTGHAGGMHVMLHLPMDGPSAAELEGRAKSLGIGIYSVKTGAAVEYGRTAYSERSLVVGYSSLTEAQIRKGIERVALAFHQLRQRK